MDGLKNIAKGGWHPSGDRAIHRDTWKSDLKGMATGKKHDPYEAARNHQSAPLSSLKDPDSFGPPPKHSAYYGNQSQALTPAARTAEPSGLGARVPAPRPKQQEPEEFKPAEPYRMNTTGLRTDNLPKPPTRSLNGGNASPASPARTVSPVLPPRQQARPNPAVARPAPVLPPRQAGATTETAPALPPPPSYKAAMQVAKDNSDLINADSVRRLGQAGVVVPALDIGSSQQKPDARAIAQAVPVKELHQRYTASTPEQRANVKAIAQAAPVSELQQRFARINVQGATSSSSSAVPGQTTGVVHKQPPPAPPKKATLSAPQAGGAPPPLPLSSKPKFG